uniref:Amino acid transporter n=1 Tax=Solanum tuberosum TaxID=4113 RepID=M1AN63_SOLTU
MLANNSTNLGLQMNIRVAALKIVVEFVRGFIHLFLELTFFGKHKRDLVLESKKLTLDRAADLDVVESWRGGGFGDGGEGDLGESRSMGARAPTMLYVGPPLAISISTLLLSFLNYTGLAIVGYVVVVLGIVSLAPFIIMSLIAIPKIQLHSGSV